MCDTLSEVTNESLENHIAFLNSRNITISEVIKDIIELEIHHSEIDESDKPIKIYRYSRNTVIKNIANGCYNRVIDFSSDRI